MLRALTLLLALAAAAPVAAGTLYRCDSADGSRSYTNKKVPGASCKVISEYRTQPGAPSAPKPAMAAKAPPAAPAAKVEFRTAPAGRPAPSGGKTSGARVSRGAVYKFEQGGVTHYTNVPPPKSRGATLLFTYVETCYACGLLPGVDFATVRLNTEAFAGEIRAAAREFGVDEALVRAVIHAESAYRPNAVSNKGAQGLMQLVPATASEFGVLNPFDPAQNIKGGVRYLRWLLDRYGNNRTLAAAGYNAGPGNVDRYGGVPPFEETRRYVERVAQLADRYHGVLAAN